MAGPELRRSHNDFLFRWPGLLVAVDRVTEGTQAVWGELTVTTADPLTPHLLGPVRVNLTGAHDRSTLARQLAAKLSEESVDWTATVEQVFALTVREVRRGASVIDLATVTPQTGVDYFIDRFIPRGQTSILFGDGGSLKSTLAVAAALTCITGDVVVPRWRLPGAGGPVLYLDWETTENDITAIMRGLCAGTGLEIPAGFFHYLPMVRPLVHEIRRIRDEISALGVTFLIVDSLGYAASDEPEANKSAIQLMTALRSLGPDVTRLCIGHIAKADRGLRGRASTFGGAYYENGARSVWEARRADGGYEDEDHRNTTESVQIALYHRKANRGERFAPQGLQVDFEADGVPSRITAARIDTTGDLGAGLTLGQRCVGLVRDRGLLSAAAVAELLDEPAGKIRVSMDRLVGKALVKLQEQDDQGKPRAVYGLRSDR